MKRIIVILSILLFLFPFQQLNVSAQTSTSIGDYKEFDSFMKRYYEHTMDLTQYVANSYQSNSYYSKEQYELFRQAINTVYDTNKNDFVSSYLDSLGNLITKPMAIMGTANDIRKKMWETVKGFFSKEELPDYPVYSSITGGDGVGFSKTFYAPEGYYYHDTVTSSNYTSLRLQHLGNYEFRVYGSGITENQLSIINNSKANHMYDFILNGGVMGIHHLMHIHGLAGGNPIVLAKKTDLNDVKPIIINATPEPFENVVNNIINHNYDDDRLRDYEPSVEPILVCPSEEIPLTFIDGQFKTNENIVITLTDNETATHNNANCQLDFVFPSIYYHDETGKLIVDGMDLSPITNLPPVEDFDSGIVEYIRNSYNYAVSVIDSGVSGLRSIISGTSGLIAFTGSVFAFLPPEIITLFVGGFSVALGLWVFKK